MTRPLKRIRQLTKRSSIGIPIVLLSIANPCFAFQIEENGMPAIRVQLTDFKDESRDEMSDELDFSDAMLQTAFGKVDAALTAFDQISNADVAKNYTKAMLLLNNGKTKEAAIILEQICNSPDAPLDTKKYLATADRKSVV